MDAAWSELHCHSAYSCLDGASHPAELVRRAAELGYPALALTDHDSLAGLIEHAQACREAGVRPIAGCEVTLTSGHHLTLLAQDATGYRSLSRIVSHAHLSGSKGAPRLTLEDLAPLASGLACLTGCRKGALSMAILAGDEEGADAALDRLCDIFGREQLWIELQRRDLPQDRVLTHGLLRAARRIGRPVVATGNTHYVTPAQRRLQDVLVCIKTRRPLAQAHGLLRSGSSWHLPAPEEMARRFADLPQALHGAVALADRCEFALSHVDATLPEFPVPDGMSATQYLRSLVEAGLRERYGDAGGTELVQRRLEHELGVIGQLDLANYFLVVWDIVREARARGILCQGRGSAVGSLVCYALGITAIEPLRHHLSFERFLSVDRTDLPDVDIDFPSDRAGHARAREEVIQYVLTRYAGHAALVSVYDTFRDKSAIRDVGKALGFAPEQIDLLAKSIDASAHGPSADTAQVWAGLVASKNRQMQLLADLCHQLGGLPRHISQHPGGIVLTRRPLAEVVPVEHARMPHRRVVQWDKDAVERAGLVKIDLLSLGMLAAIDRCFDYLEGRDGVRPALHGFTCDDPRVYDLICEPDTIGLFQIESRAQQNACLPQLQPRCFEDLVAAVAIIRPGPIQADATHPFLRRRQGFEPITYPGGAIGRRLLEPVLGSTAGVCIFQDQVIEIARRCGLRPDEAAELRRAISSTRSPERMAALRQRLLDGLAAVGLDAEAQAQVVKVIEAFSGFGFVRGHAASFAYLAYVSAWLKRFHGAALAAALLETQPMGFYRVETIVQDAQRHGVTVLPVDLRHSRAEATVEGMALRLGLRQIKGLGDETCRRLETMVADAAPDDLRALFAAAEVTEAEARALARGGALDGYFPDRRQALWHAPLLARDARQRPLLPASDGRRVPLDAPTPLDTFMLDHQTLGFSVQGHVLQHVRPRLQRPLPRACDLANLPSGARVEIVGQFELRQQPATAHGMRFILLSDETGLINLVATPDVYTRYRSVIRTEPLLWVDGVLEHRGRSISIRVRRIRRGVDLLRPEAATH